MKIFIAVPSMDQVPAPFAQSLATLNRVGDCMVGFQIGSLIYDSRNNLARRAIQAESDYVLWLDSDMVFNPDMLQRLFESKEKTGAAIVSGLYFRRVPPFSPVVFNKLEINGKRCEWTEFDEIPPEPFEVGGCGFGCVLMDTDVLIDVFAREGDLFGPINGVGEDLSFCYRARKWGHNIICDPTIPLGHVGTTVINREFFNVYHKAGKQ